LSDTFIGEVVMSMTVSAIEICPAKSLMSCLTVGTVRSCDERLSEVLRVALVLSMESGTNEAFVVVVCRRKLRLGRAIVLWLMMSLTDVA
jgi:hypothetical protein